MDTSEQDWLKFNEWRARIPGYECMKRDSRKRAKEAWKKMHTDQTHPNWVQDHHISLGTLKEVEDETTGYTFSWECQKPPAEKMSMEDFNRAYNALKTAQCKKELENIMSTISVNTNDRQDQQVRYLRDRLERVFFRKDLKARRFFGMVDDESPKTAKDLVERIKSDNFVISKAVAEFEEDEDYEGSYYSAIGHIKWRSPDKKKDPEGYKEWSETNEETYDRIKDAVFVLEPAEGLKALQEYEDAPIQ